MSIRLATNADAVNISGLVKSLAHFYLDEPSRELPAWLSSTLTEHAFTERLSSEVYINLVYEKGQEIVGYIALKKPNHLYHLFVAEQYQGKGISRQLWQQVKELSQQTAFTLRSSIHAVPIYKRFGFVESGAVGTKDGVSFQPMLLTG